MGSAVIALNGTAGTRTTRVLSWIVACIMAVQSVSGLAAPRLYRDTGWVASTWFGNDLMTLILGVPLLLAGMILASRGSVRGQLVWLAGLAFGLYNYGFYLFGASLNVFFPLYVAGFVCSMVALVMVLARIDASGIAAAFSPKTPVRAVAGFMAFIGVGLGFAWLGQWAAYVFGGTVPAPGVEPFAVVAAMDMSFVVPFMLLGAILLWRGAAWGYVLAPVMAVKGASYMAVLSFNSGRMMAQGSSSAGGELAVWGGIGIACLIATAVLLACVKPSHADELIPRVAVLAEESR